ncbi:MAG: ATP-binding protein, partial [Alkalispirochaeta sp.]
TRFTGSIVNEEEYVARVLGSGDQMSMAGLRTVKSFLLLYADRPEEVFEQLTVIEPIVPAMSLLHENLLIRFYLAIVAYRLNRPDIGDRMLRIIRRWARENPGTHRHRLLFVRAERAALHGHRRSARRLLDRAFPVAVRAGFANEAALIAERAGDISGELSYWMAAESAYRQWGAINATARVRRKLGRSGSCPAVEPVTTLRETFHHDFIRAQSMEDVMTRTARYLLTETYASQVVISIVGTAAEVTAAYGGTGSDIVHLGTPSSDLSLILGETPPDEYRLLNSEDSLRSGASGVVGRSARVYDSEAAVIIVAAAGGAPYARSVVEVVRSVLRTVVIHAALLSAQARISAGEEQLQETQRQLSDTERYRRQLFSTVTDAFLLMDQAGTVLFSNPAAEPFLDRTLPSSTELRHDLREPFRSLLDSFSIGWSGASRGVRRHRTNDQRHVQMQVAPVGSDDENLVAVSISDITETVEREMQLSRQERQLVVADRLASIGMFSASIVHEISNPNHILQLNTQSLQMVLSWLRSEVRDEHAAATVSQASDLVGQIEDAAQRVESVLQMVKSYSREGRQERWDVYAPEEICARAFRFSKIMASQYTDHFRLAVDPELGRVWGEGALLEQALVNLIKNACEALPARDGRVELQTYQSGDEVILAVCDTGDGFPPELSDAPGTPFASSRQDEGGTGLGLSIVAAIVEKHGGHLRVGTDEVFTTRVAIHLPVHGALVEKTSVSSD